MKPYFLTILIASTILIIPTPCTAESAAENQQTHFHLINIGKGYSYKEVDLLSINKSIKESAEEYMDIGIVARYAQYDTCLPADRQEYRDLNKNAVVLIVALTHKKNELPLKRVYLNYSGEEIALEMISSNVSEVEDVTVGTVFGGYREDSFYLLPMHFLVKDCELAIDWGENRDGFILGKYPTEINVDFIGEDENLDKQDPQLNTDALKGLLEREYSVIFE